MKNLKKIIEWVVKNWQKSKELVEYGMETGVCDEEILLDAEVITKAEYKAIKNENDEVYQEVLGRIHKAQGLVCSGCVECGGCYGCSAKRMCSKNTVTVDLEKWRSAIGAGGGSEVGTVEIPEVCARGIAQGLGMSLKEYLEYMG